MKHFLAISLLFYHVCCYAQTNLVAVRNTFYRVSAEKAPCASLLKSIDNATGEPKSVLNAYKGMYHMLAARDFINPFAKWSSFKKGRIMLDDAVESDSDNPEIRLLRLSAQINAPSFLGYNNNIEADKRVILRTLKNITDDDLRQRVVNFLEKQQFIPENS